MIFAILLAPAAEADLVEAINWYESRHPGLSFELRLSLEAALDQIARHPESGTEVAPTVRRALLRRFPHAVYYRQKGNVIEIVAILYTHQDPRRWQKRQYPLACS